MAKISNLLKKVFNRQKVALPDALVPVKNLSDKDLELIKVMGTTYDQLMQSVNASMAINYERMSIYRELERAQAHWLMASACSLFADASTPYNIIQNRSIWVTAKDTKYQKTLEKFFDEIEIEEKLYDWAWNLAGFGDLFIEVNGHPGLGVISINDSNHPSAVSRIDYDGALLGFYKTPMDMGGLSSTTGNVNTDNSAELATPWAFVHMRILGAIKRRPLNNDVTYNESRAVYLMGMETKQLTTKYGTSLLFDGLPVYKRLRMSEDAVLLARLTRGIKKYIYKIKCDSSNAEASGQMVQEYMNILKNARAINFNNNSPNYENVENLPGVIEDLFCPVFGDTGDVSIEEIGGDVDIKWLQDIEELRNQLACSLRVPLSLLGGYVQEASGQLGSEAIGKLDMRFSRSARRLQRAIINGVRRLCQIHLAYMGLDPDPRLFDVQMGETSTAEEEQIKDALDTSSDVVSKFMDMVDNLGVKVDKVKILDYFNKKMLKLNDFKIEDFVINEPVAGMETPAEVPEEPTGGEGEEIIADGIEREFYNYLPINENCTSRLSNINEAAWNKLYKGKKVKIEVKKDTKKGK